MSEREVARGRAAAPRGRAARRHHTRRDRRARRHDGRRPARRRRARPSSRRADATTLEALHATGWPETSSRRPFRRLELHRGRPLSDAVLDRRPVWLEDAAQWRLRYPDMAAVGTAADMQASACLPLRVEDRDLGAVVFSFARAAARSPPRSASSWWRSPRCARRASTGPACWCAERTARETAERQLGRMTFLSRTTRLMEAPLSVEERLQQLADLAVSEIADWCAVHLVRGNRVDQVAVAHSDPTKVAFVARLRGALPARPGRGRRSDAGEPHRRARLLPRDPRRAARRRRRRRRAPRPHPVHRDALGAGRAAGRARAEAGRAHPRAGGVRARASTRPTSPSPSSWRPPRPSRWTTPGSTSSSGTPRTPCRPRCCRPTCPRCPGCASPPATAPRPTSGPTCTSAATSTTSCRSRGRVRRRRRRRLRQGRRGRRAHRADPAHRARGDRPRARARRGAGAAQPGDAPRERRAARPVRDRRAGPAHPHPDRRHRAAGQRRAPAAARAARRPGRRPCPRRARCSASIRTSP